MNPDEPIGRIDVHSHLLPGIDDGCPTLEDSLACAAALVEAGYTHSVCTPHVWPSLPSNNPQIIPHRVGELQRVLDERGIALRLIPGGEMNLTEKTEHLDANEIVTYAMAGRYVLIDLWAQQLPAHFPRAIRRLQGLGLKVVLAHPERMRAVQENPGLADRFAEMGLLLQGNLQCLGDPPDTFTRRVAELFLEDDRYFMLGSDLHNFKSLPIRLKGLKRAIEAAGEQKVLTLTRENPLEAVGGRQ